MDYLYIGLIIIFLQAMIIAGMIIHNNLKAAFHQTGSEKNNNFKNINLNSSNIGTENISPSARETADAEPVFDHMFPDEAYTDDLKSILAGKKNIGSEYLEIDEYKNTLRNNENYLYSFFGERFICFSKNHYDLLLRAIRLTRGNMPLLFYGEVGTFRRGLARALHHYRGGNDLNEVSCSSESFYSISQEIKHFNLKSDGGCPGLLLSDIDRLDQKGFDLLETLLSNSQKNKYIYFTASPGFLNQEEILPPALFKAFMDLSIKTIPVRERKEDIFFQILHKTMNFNESVPDSGIKKITRNFMEKALSYWWAGNTLELQRVITREILESSGGILENFSAAVSESGAGPNVKLTPLEEGEKKIINEYLQKHNFNKSRTKKELGISINTLNTKIEKYGIVIR